VLGIQGRLEQGFRQACRIPFIFLVPLAGAAAAAATACLFQCLIAPKLVLVSTPAPQLHRPPAASFAAYALAALALALAFAALAAASTAVIVLAAGAGADAAAWAVIPPPVPITDGALTAAQRAINARLSASINQTGTATHSGFDWRSVYSASRVSEKMF
jgi:hypothetical protein